MSNAEWTWLTLSKCMVGSGLEVGWQIVLKRKNTNGQEIYSYQCSTSLATGKMESKGLSWEPRITNAGLGCGKGNPFYHRCEGNSTAFMKSIQIILSNSQKNYCVRQPYHPCAYTVRSPCLTTETLMHLPLFLPYSKEAKLAWMFINRWLDTYGTHAWWNWFNYKDIWNYDLEGKWMGLEIATLNHVAQT